MLDHPYALCISLGLIFNLIFMLRVLFLINKQESLINADRSNNMAQCLAMGATVAKTVATMELKKNGKKDESSRN
jgi:hypothetical protein